MRGIEELKIFIQKEENFKIYPDKISEIKEKVF